jgi:hypothetical protein
MVLFEWVLLSDRNIGQNASIIFSDFSSGKLIEDELFDGRRKAANVKLL